MSGLALYQGRALHPLKGGGVTEVGGHEGSMDWPKDSVISSARQDGKSLSQIIVWLTL